MNAAISKLLKTKNARAIGIYISKSRNTKDNDIEKFSGLFLLIIDPNDKVVLTQPLQENLQTFGLTNESSWNLNQDSLLTIASISSFCSDDVTVGQENLSCHTDKIKKVYRLRCDGVELIKQDSMREQP
jgi:hypothetical protein